MVGTGLVLVMTLLPMKWTNPCVNADSVSCLQPGVSTLTDLGSLVVKMVRYRDNDTLTYELPRVGKSCLPDSADFEIEAGTMGEIIFYPKDVNGNINCRGTHYVFAIPAANAISLPDSGQGLRGSYFSGRNFEVLSGSRIDSNVDFDWDSGSPIAGCPPDTFSVRWTGRLMVPTSGNYTIYVSSEDGFRLYLDNTLVRDWWQLQFEQEISTTISLSQGSHDIKLEYFNRVGHAACHLRWSGPGFVKQVIPGNVLSY